MDNDILYLGVTSFEYLGTKINIYSKERLLIELIRYKFDISYKEGFVLPSFAWEVLKTGGLNMSHSL